MTDRCFVSVSLARFKENVSRAKMNLAGTARLMIAVKSNAYGHGGIELGAAAVQAGAEGLAVLDIPTGLELRSVTENALLLCWLHSPSSNFGRAVQANLDLGVSALWQLDALEKQAPKSQARVHLKIDTGLHRNGAMAKDWPALVKRSRRMESEGHIRVIGIWSHLSDTSVTDNLESLERFYSAVDLAKKHNIAPEILHIAASMAALEQPEARLDMVRVGIIAYGVSPLPERKAEELGFLPVMSVHAKVLERRFDSGEAIVGMGFSDGLLPPMTNQGWIHHRSSSFSIRSVDAERLTIATSDSESLPMEGETLTLWGSPDGKSPKAEDWASWAKTIGDEVVTSIADHVPRYFI